MKTFSAIKAFQKSHDLEQTGLFDFETVKKLLMHPLAIFPSNVASEREIPEFLYHRFGVESEDEN